MFSDDEIAEAYQDDLDPRMQFTPFHEGVRTVIVRSGTPGGLASPLVSEDTKRHIRSLGGKAVHARGKAHVLTPEIVALARARANAANRAKGRMTRIATVAARVNRLRAKLAAAIAELEAAQAADAELVASESCRTNQKDRASRPLNDTGAVRSGYEHRVAPNGGEIGASPMNTENDHV